jgi:flagellar basal body-associated protein FliL
MTMENQAGDPTLPRRRGLIISIALNGVLFVLVCGMVLYAFMLKVDLDEGKRRLAKEVETRQQVEIYLTETRNLLTNSLREIEQLKEQLAWKESDYQAAASAKPALPVVVDFRASVLGKGLVAVINNASDRYLTLVLAVRNPTLSTAKRFKLELNPKSSIDFGHLEGWQFASGDEVELFNDDFRALKITVP